jgi:hypothetical protein
MDGLRLIHPQFPEKPDELWSIDNAVFSAQHARMLAVDKVPAK